VAGGSERPEKRKPPWSASERIHRFVRDVPLNRSNISGTFTEACPWVGHEALDPEALQTRDGAPFNAAPARHAWNFLAARQFH
jgi:hypothetical protein